MDLATKAHLLITEKTTTNCSNRSDFFRYCPLAPYVKQDQIGEEE